MQAEPFARYAGPISEGLDGVRRAAGEALGGG